LSRRWIRRECATWYHNNVIYDNITPELTYYFYLASGPDNTIIRRNVLLTTPVTGIIDDNGTNTLGDIVIGTLADDATPSISNGDRWLTGGTTTITDFDDGITGQEIKIIAEHSLTITDGTNIFLSGSANWAMTATDTLTLICKADNKWYELSRSDSGA